MAPAHRLARTRGQMSFRGQMRITPWALDESKSSRPKNPPTAYHLFSPILPYLRLSFLFSSPLFPCPRPMKPRNQGSHPVTRVKNGVPWIVSRSLERTGSEFVPIFGDTRGLPLIDPLCHWVLRGIRLTPL